jgi:hypothetical protein
VISAQAKDSIDRIFRQAARSRLPVDANDSCEIESGEFAEADGEEIVVLTISSIFFRVLVILQFGQDEAAQRYYLGAGQGTLRESILEVGNLCCGAMNQQLVEYFPDLGMSTPYVLNSHCVAYLDQLKPKYVSSYRVTINGTVRLGATLCVCADAPLDFVANVSDVMESVGELELF